MLHMVCFYIFVRPFRLNLSQKIELWCLFLISNFGISLFHLCFIVLEFMIKYVIPNFGILSFLNNNLLV
jgi:hypothetical protein